MTAPIPQAPHPVIDYAQRVGMLFLVGVVVEWIIEHWLAHSAMNWAGKPRT